MKFKMGDRVAFYISSFGRHVGRVCEVRLDGCLSVQENANDMRLHIVHPKQCRLLKKKERRRIWANIVGKKEIGLGEFSFMQNHNWIEFVEVKRK